MSEGIRISEVFTDYDGTLAPLDVPVQSSRPDLKLELALRKVAERAKLAAITSKDFGFIRERLPYADAWACVAGLDIRFSDGTFASVECRLNVQKALDRATELLGDAVLYEPKWGHDGLLGFSLDWRGKEMPANVLEVADALGREGLYVYHSLTNPYMDVLCGPPAKGYALLKIRDVWRDGAGGGSIFLGDSIEDNSAFLEADVSVGVDHGQPLEDLTCTHVVNESDVVKLFQGLLERDMVFTPDLVGSRNR